MEDLTPVLLTWGFNPRNGKLELDCFLELNTEKAAEAVKMIYLRAAHNNHQVALFHVPQGSERGFVEEWLSLVDTKTAVDKFKKGKVAINDVVRRKNETNAIDFILGG